MRTLNADVLSSGLVGDPETLKKFKELHRGPALTLFENDRPTFSMGLHKRPDDRIEAWIKITEEADLKVCVKFIKRALSLVNCELIAQVGGRDEHEEAICEKFMRRFGFMPDGDKEIYEVQHGKLMMTRKANRRLAHAS